MRHLLIGFLLTAAILLLSSCESLLRVDTFNKQYAASMTAVQAVYTLAAAGVESGKISKEEGLVLLQGADTVRDIFATARIARQTKPEEGTALMQLGLAALEALQTELKRVTKP